jgi:hypothetical protein
MSAGAPAPPTIVINTPGTSTSTVSAPRPTPAQEQPTKRPEKPTLVKQCYLCDEQNPGDFSPTTKFLETCLLCSRHFCPIHKSVNWDQVCNINHAEYYRECLEKARKEMIAQGKTGESRTVAESLINEGIYPSLGEREKAIFTTSPVSECKWRTSSIIGEHVSDKMNSPSSRDCELPKPGCCDARDKHALEKSID